MLQCKAIDDIYECKGYDKDKGTWQNHSDHETLQVAKRISIIAAAEYAKTNDTIRIVDQRSGVILYQA